MEVDKGMEDVKITIRDITGGGKVARLMLPMKLAHKLAETGKIRIGWSRCRVKLLEKRTPTCYRCQQSGHLAVSCKTPSSEVMCFRCRKLGHMARECCAESRGKSGDLATPEKGNKPKGEGGVFKHPTVKE